MITATAASKANVAAQGNPPAARAGVLTALYSGLSAATTELCMAVACDMPFLNTELLRWLVGQADGWDLVMPRIEGQMDPMHAVYRREPCLGSHSAVTESAHIHLSFGLPSSIVRQR